MPDPLSGEPDVPVLLEADWWNADADYVFGDDPDDGDAEGADSDEAG